MNHSRLLQTAEALGLESTHMEGHFTLLRHDRPVAALACVTDERVDLTVGGTGITLALDFEMWEGVRSPEVVAGLLLEQALLGGLRIVRDPGSSSADGAGEAILVETLQGPRNPTSSEPEPWPRASDGDFGGDPPRLHAMTTADLGASVVDLLPARPGVAVLGAEADRWFGECADRMAASLRRLGELEELASVGSAWLVRSSDGWRFVELRYENVFVQRYFAVVIAGDDRTVVRNFAPQGGLFGRLIRWKENAVSPSEVTSVVSEVRGTASRTGVHQTLDPFSADGVA